jgi:hypothetical protein
MDLAKGLDAVAALDGEDRGIVGSDRGKAPFA